MIHPWHDVSVGEEFPNIVTGIIEVPKGSKAKYELDKDSGLLRLDRVLFSSVHYPANYGFIPQTLCGDGDPLDILVLGQLPTVPLCLLRAKPIGVMKMFDQGEEDDKIIAVHADDAEYDHYNSINELPPHRLKELRRFFEDYKALENKKVEVGDFFDEKQARDVVMDSINMYRAEFAQKKSASA